MGKARITFKGDARFPELIGRSVEMGALMGSIGSEIASTASAIGPKDDDAPHYVDQIQADQGLLRSRQGMVQGCRVNAFKFTSHWIEFGSINNPAFAPLRRATEAQGLRLSET